MRDYSRHSIISIAKGAEMITRFRMMAGLLPVLLLCGMLPVDADEGEEKLPGKIHKLLEMDAIPAIKEPTYVSADKAKVPDDARVIAVEIGGETRCFDPNILNDHEIVNTEIGGKKVAVTW
jgi:hypothetical protein